ncbi:MAG: fused signal recognition particle receptor [Arenicella sp.]|jgi:fused signal recognition particle receptor
MTETNNPKEHKHTDQPLEQKKRSGFARFFGREKDSDQQTSAEPVTVEAGLDKSRSSLLGKIGDVFKGSFDINDELFDDLEEVLITCDIGVEASLELVDKLRQRVQTEKIQDAAGVVAGLKAEIATMLEPAEQPWSVLHQRPYVMLMVGVNGVGKTTTTAKIAKQFRDQGKTVMLAAADTFRAAAVEQLQEWGRRMDIPVVAQAHGADAAAVAHDALSSAIVKGTEVLIIDTAGRLHTQSDLMEQLQKINRVLRNLDPSMPHEVMQILDAGTGQNAMSQLEHFQKAVGVTSICLTKLDGSAKGGLAISLTQKYKLPIRYIGVGEGYMDLKLFNAKAFADALVPDVDQLKADQA